MKRGIFEMFSLSSKKLVSVLAAIVCLCGIVPVGAAAEASEEATEVYQYVSVKDTWIRSSQKNSDSNKVVSVPKGRYIQVTKEEYGWGYATCFASDGNLYGGWTPLYQYKYVGFAPPETSNAPSYKVITSTTDNSKKQDIPEALPTPPMPDGPETSGESTATTNTGYPSGVENNKTKKKVYDYLINTLGFNRAAACGIMVNVQEESKFNPAIEIIDTNEEPSIGLFQWNGERCQAFKDYCDARTLEYGSVDAQLQYLSYELKNKKSIQYKKMLAFEDSDQGAYDAAYYWASKFEICSQNRWEPRAQAGQKLYLS